MKRRHFLGGMAGAVAVRGADTSTSCGCAPFLAQNALGSEAFRGLGSRLKITGVKVFGVSLTPDSDRPYVFVKIETDGGIVGWGEGTLEGKAAAVIARWRQHRLRRSLRPPTP